MEAIMQNVSETRVTDGEAVVSRKKNLYDYLGIICKLSRYHVWTEEINIADSGVKHCRICNWATITSKLIDHDRS